MQGRRALPRCSCWQPVTSFDAVLDWPGPQLCCASCVLCPHVHLSGMCLVTESDLNRMCLACHAWNGFDL